MEIQWCPMYHRRCARTTQVTAPKTGPDHSMEIVNSLQVATSILRIMDWTTIHNLAKNRTGWNTAYSMDYVLHQSPAEHQTAPFNISTRRGRICLPASACLCLPLPTLFGIYHTSLSTGNTHETRGWLWSRHIHKVILYSIQNIFLHR